LKGKGWEHKASQRATARHETAWRRYSAEASMPPLSKWTSCGPAILSEPSSPRKAQTANWFRRCHLQIKQVCSPQERNVVSRRHINPGGDHLAPLQVYESAMVSQSCLVMTFMRGAPVRSRAIVPQIVFCTKISQLIHVCNGC
jgi:hypothetical protein